MSKKQDYVFYKCRDCEIDFLLARRGIGHKLPYCPRCGENLFTEKVMDMCLERPFQYKRQWTTDEDEMIAMGRANGYTHQQIANSLDGRTLRAVTKRWAELKKRGMDQLPEMETVQ